VRDTLLCPWLAWGNLKNNRRDYLPFLGAAALIVCLFFTVCNLSLIPDFGRHISGGGNLQALMVVGTLLLPVVCGPFLWYINSFLMKRRRKEMGLYGVLGLEQRHVGAVLFFETLYSFLVSVGGGLLLGILLLGLATQLLLGMAGVKTDFTPTIVPGAVCATAALFGIIFLGCLGGNLVHLSLAAPNQLLREDHSGERDPRFGVLGGVLGALLLGGGYYISIRAYFDPLLVGGGNIFLAFPAASLLVALGTYGVFIFGSIYLLKALKGNRDFYYQPRNFVTLSGMLHRMRKNGAGLANICLFGTMTLVTLCCTLTVALGQDQVAALLGTSNEGRGDFVLNLERMDLSELTILFGTLAFLGLFSQSFWNRLVTRAGRGVRRPMSSVSNRSR
jgi:putative ABC transport system permease protein